MSSLHSLHAELGPGGHWVHWGLFSQTLNEAFSPKNESRNIAKNSKVHPGRTFFQKRKIPNSQMIFQHDVVATLEPGKECQNGKRKKLRKNGKCEVRGSLAEAGLLEELARECLAPSRRCHKMAAFLNVSGPPRGCLSGSWRGLESSQKHFLPCVQED